MIYMYHHNNYEEYFLFAGTKIGQITKLVSTNKKDNKTV